MQLQLFNTQEYTLPQRISPFKWMGRNWIDDFFIAVGKTLCTLITAFGMYYILSRQIEARTRQENKIEEVYRKLSEEDEDELLQTACPDLSSFQRACMTDEHKEQVVKQELRELILN